MRTLSASITLGLLLTCSTAHAVDDTWTLIAEKDGIKSYRKSQPGSKFLGFAGDGVIDADIARVMATVYDLKRYIEYVDLLKEVEPVAQGERDFTIWQHYDLSWPVRDRDYALRGTVEPDADKKSVTLTWTSITDPRIPEKDCCIRAQLTRTFFRFTALPGGKTRIECEIVTDPRGKLPAWMANMVQKNWPYNTIKGHERQARKADVVPHPDYVGWR